MKRCPFCSEEIQSEAIKCRYCKEFSDQKSLQEAHCINQSRRQTFLTVGVADYLRVSTKIIENWVKKGKMPLSKLGKNQIVFHKKNIDKWISDKAVTEYQRPVSARKTLDALLPPAFNAVFLTRDDSRIH